MSAIKVVNIYIRLVRSFNLFIRPINTAALTYCVVLSKIRPS
jgi:hypothetical protein